MKIVETMVINFVNKYGVDGLRRIVMLFERRISNEKIAKEFSVTRQRVHQWQRVFTLTNVRPTDQVRKMLCVKS